MDIEKIKAVVNNNQLNTDLQKELIIGILSKDRTVIPLILDILSAERNSKDELIEDMNLELSKADIYIENPLLGNGDKKTVSESKKLQNSKAFIQQSITNFYNKYKDYVKHCFVKP